MVRARRRFRARRGRSALHRPHAAPRSVEPAGFAGLRAAGRTPRRIAPHLAVADHAVPTHGRGQAIADHQARAQVALLEANCRAVGVAYLPLDDVRQGIVHVIGPEQGFTLPGITLVCGDSHTATHGAFGALAFGIGSSEAECVLATRTLRQKKARTMRVTLDGAPGTGVSARIWRSRWSGGSVRAGPSVTPSNMPGRRCGPCRRRRA